MRRTATISGLFALGLLAVTAAGQPPAGDKDRKPAEKKAADPTDALIAAALANDPDVLTARAKLQLAQAELTKARQQTTQKVLTLQAEIRAQQGALRPLEQRHDIIQKAMQQARASLVEVLEVQERLEAARAKLARLELDLKLLTGGGPGAATAACEPARKAGITDCAKCHADPLGAGPPAGGDFRVPVGDGIRVRIPPLGEAAGQDRAAARQFFEWMMADAAAARGPIPDRIRAALDKKVKLGPKGQAVPFDKALEAFKADAGLDVPVRTAVPVNPVTSLGEELPVGAWFQMYADETPGAVFVVREYGILTAGKQTAPGDALTLTQFWQTKPAAKPGPTTSLAPTAEGVLKGKPIKLSLDDTETLILAAVRFRAKSTGVGDPPLVLERELTAVLKGDHVRLVVPEPARYGTNNRANSLPQEVLIDLSKYPDDYPAVYTRYQAGRNEVSKYMNPKPDAAAEFTAALQKLGIGK